MGAESFDTASDVAVEFNWRCGVVLRVMSERDLPLGWRPGAAVAVAGVVRPPADVVALVCAPPVVTATPAGVDVVVEPVDVEVMVDVDVEDAGELDVPVFGLADAGEVESEDDELDGSAHAIPWLVKSIALTPSATARPPVRATYAALRTQQL